MPTPTYQQLTTLSSSANGLQSETMEERILSVLAMMVSGQNPDGSTNTSVPANAPSPYAFDRLFVAGGEADYPRYLITTNGLVIQAGWTYMMGFVALRTETCNNIVSYTHGTAGVGMTTCQMAVYQFDNSGNATLLTQTANDPTLWTATFTKYSRPLQSPFNKVAGNFYAMAAVEVGATTPPTLLEITNNGGLGAIQASLQLSPPSAVRVNSVLPATATNATMATGSALYMEVLP